MTYDMSSDIHVYNDDDDGDHVDNGDDDEEKDVNDDKNDFDFVSKQIYNSKCSLV